MFTQPVIQVQIKENIKALCHWPGTGEFPAQMASNVENVSIWWRHHVWRLLKLHFLISPRGEFWSYKYTCFFKSYPYLTSLTAVTSVKMDVIFKRQLVMRLVNDSEKWGREYNVRNWLTNLQPWFYIKWFHWCFHMWHWNQKTKKYYFQESALQNVICKMVAFCSCLSVLITSSHE